MPSLFTKLGKSKNTISGMCTDTAMYLLLRNISKLKIMLKQALPGQYFSKTLSKIS